jgi:hypothetical protein
MGTSPVYDEIGRGYAVTRRPDPRIARAIDAALGEARSVVNVGAGAGSYGHLRIQDNADLGYRLLVAEPRR